MSKSIDRVDELQKTVSEITSLFDRAKELGEKTFVDLVVKFVSDTQLLKIPNERVLEEVRKALKLNVTKRIQNATVKVKLQGWEKGVTYYNPENQNENWVGGKKGPKPDWLEKQFTSDMNLDAMKAVFAGLQKK